MSVCFLSARRYERQQLPRRLPVAPNARRAQRHPFRARRPCARPQPVVTRPLLPRTLHCSPSVDELYPRAPLPFPCQRNVTSLREHYYVISHAAKLVSVQVMLLSIDLCLCVSDDARATHCFTSVKAVDSSSLATSWCVRAPPSQARLNVRRRRLVQPSCRRLVQPSRRRR